MVMEHRWTLEEFAQEEDAQLSPIYISGPISKLPYEVAKERFKKSQKRLYSAGSLIAWNPMSFCDRDWEYGRCMRVCIEYLLNCKAIYMQRLWWISKGARLERKIALSLRLPVIYE